MSAIVALSIDATLSYRLHPSAALVEFVAGDDRIDVLARPGEIDVIEEVFRGDRFRVVTARPAEGAARSGVIFGERERHRVRLVFPMLDRVAQIPDARF